MSRTPFHGTTASQRLALATAFCAGLLAPPAGAAAGPGITLEPHRAVYDLTLESRDSDASVSAVRGRMVHEFSGAACDGYSISMRWVAQMTDTDGSVSIDDVRFASWEDGGGDNYTYSSTRFLNDRKIEEVNASAEFGSSGGRVELTKPEEDAFPLPAGTMFPTEHLRSVLEAARAGKIFAEEVVYDVSENGRQVYNTMAVVGSHTITDVDADIEGIAGTERLADIPAWRVTMSYFKGDSEGEETPAFEQTFNLYANGVASSLRLDYGEIVIKGTLKDLEFLTAPTCDEGAAAP